MNTQYYRVMAQIDCEALSQNIKAIRKSLNPGTQLMAVVKADGYGHGLQEIYPTLEKSGIDQLAVAVLKEGVSLRRMGSPLPVLILGYTAPSDYETVIAEGLTQTIFTSSMAKAMSDAAVSMQRAAKVHIKLDTGMGRIGFACTESALDEIQAISQLPGLQLEGIFTHFARADERDKSATRQQYARFQWMCDELEKRGVTFPVRHVSNSAAIMELPDMNCNMVRAGIILYGLYPSDEVQRETLALRPVMTFKSHVIFCKEVPDGSPVSYGGTYVAKGTRRIGTIPVGYADGYSRRLSGIGHVLIRGHRVPIAGRICMDQFMVDLTPFPDIQEGDEAILFGEGLSVDELARLTGTINYEMVCMVSKRVPRVIK